MRRAPSNLTSIAKQSERAQDSPPEVGIPKAVRNAGGIEYEINTEDLGKTRLTSGNYAGQTLREIIGSIAGKSHLATIFQLVPNDLKRAIAHTIDTD
jgi:hypothetical protein